MGSSRLECFFRSIADKWKYLGLWLLPKNALSRLMGRFAELRKPALLVEWQIGVFCKLFAVNLNECAQPIESYGSLQDFFTRRLKPGARTIDKSEHSLTAPCDGFWGSSGIATQGQAVQIKGKHYHLANLLGLNSNDTFLEKSTYATFYLSPKDYHRFHSPIDGHIVSMTYIPGFLWPVNSWAVNNVENLFCVNERVVMAIRPLADPSHLMYLVAVGATMVGKIHVEFGRDPLNKPQGYLHREYGHDEYFFAQGQELGRFMFGSTLVLVANSSRALIQCEAMGKVLTLGECIGRTTYDG